MNHKSQNLFDWELPQVNKFITTYYHKAGLPNNEPRSQPKLTVLNYSGGRQSAALLWMLIKDDIPRPDHFVALNADPGMENSETYKYNDMMKTECDKVGIELFLKVPGPNLYKDLLELPSKAQQKPFRFDNPPYWTPPQKLGVLRGQLMQKCTKYYKIAPMDRMVRVVLERDFGISRSRTNLGENIVEKWIGLHYDELPRISAPRQKYTYFRYPLIEMKLGKKEIDEYYNRNKINPPPRSVCNACFANGLKTLKEMHDNRPNDWQQALNVCRVVRHGLRGAMVEKPVYIHESCLPLEEIANRDFKIGSNKLDQDRWSCDSGYCFT